MSSPAPLFESINSLVFSLLYGPTLTSVHDYWKKKWRWQYVLLSAKWCLCFLMLSRFVTWIKVVAFIKSVFKTMVSRAHSIIRHQFSSVAQSCPTLCDPTNRITPGLPVHHQLPEFTQTHAHWVGDAIQPSHPLSSPSPPAPKLS